MEKLLMFPGAKREPQREPVRRGPPSEHRIKYFTGEEIRLLRRTVRDQAALHKAKRNVTTIREWLAIDILTRSGLRANEVANLRCGDALIGYGKKALFVRQGKWGKSRTVQIPDGLRDHLRKYLRWKEQRGEPTGPEDHLFLGKQGPWTRQAVQGLVRKYLEQLALYEPG